MSAYAYEAVLDALGDPTRRRVLELVRDTGPAPVGAIAAELPVSRPAVSQHLRVLEGAGLVTSEKQGTRHLYAVQPDGLAGSAALARRVLGRRARPLQAGGGRE